MEITHLAIVGGRTFTDRKRLDIEVDIMRNRFPGITHIVSGDATSGADVLGRNYARANKLKYIGYPAEWDDMSEPCIVKYNQYGKAYNALAGNKRNIKVAESVHVGIAFWDGRSPGTKDVIQQMKDRGVTVEIVNY